MTKNNILLTLLITIGFFHSCATYDSQYKDDVDQGVYPSKKEINKTFYLVGDAGNAVPDGSTEALLTFENYLKTQPKNDNYTIFLGDNIYPDGMPPEDAPDRGIAEHRIDAQYNAVKEHEGKVFFIPGNHEWYNGHSDGVKRQEDYIEKIFNDNEIFRPGNGCPLESYDIDENVHLIFIDTQWYLEDWNKDPKMNENCEIKTREKFFIELEGDLKKNQHKTIVIAMHHPMYTNGVHGGKFALIKHLYPSQSSIPFPILGSLVTEIRTQGGVSKQDRFNEKYNELMKRIKVLVGDYDRIIFASGHEHALQYIEDDGLKQIVSGSGSKLSSVELGDNGLFTYGGEGFAVVDVFKDGSSWVRYYGSDGDYKPKLLFQKELYGPKVFYDASVFGTNFPKTVKSSVYEANETEKSEIFKSAWGDHYREIYGKDVTAPVALLDTLYGGLEVVRPGGGHQTVSLRLRSKDGREYNMRALRKNAVQFIQTVVLKENEVEDDLRNTVPESLILDFYTASHPYAAFAIPKLSDAVHVLNTTPKLFYVPKQPALKEYNEEYGDELYMIVQRPTEEFDGSIFEYPDDIESTDDILNKLRSDEENVVDETAYIRARIFDMLIGDWDRHNDQWRWAEYKNKNGKDVYVPIPRDRDQVFTNFDGTILNIARTLFGAAKQFQVYDENLKDIKWFNNAGIKLDRALAQQSGKNVWLEQADYIQKNITNEVIDSAFLDLPPEVRTGETIEEIKKNLKGRRDNLVDITQKYFDYFSKLQTVTGTDKDDFFEITRGDNETTIKVWRIKDGKKADEMLNRTYSSKETNQIWVFGLDDDDVFEVKGSGNNPIFVRIIGGQNNDIYRIENGRKIKIYDHQSLPNTIEEKGGANFRLTDNYDYNTYDYQKQILRTNVVTPAFGYNPDDGISLGASDIYTVNAFQRNPFSQQHRFRVDYFFATQGFDINYEGEFAGIKNTWNMLVTGRYTTSNFAQNFFGFGNETPNFDDDLGLDYNRVRLSRIEGSVGLLKNSDYGSTFKVRALFQGIDVDDNVDRFINDNDIIEQASRKFFGTLEASFVYHSADNYLNPTRGMDFNLTGGYTNNLADNNARFGYINPSLGFYNAISKNRKLVLKTLGQAQFRIGDDYEFYQAAQLGQNTGLRGYRFERFTGKNLLSGSADLRYAFNTLKTSFLPLQFGIFGGYDIGRVWLAENDFSDKWHDSYGLGFWVNSADALSGTCNFFTSDEGLRVSFGFGFNF
ncbi:MAG: metallophosphoesterase [Leeuwenhoekiella sp.]